MIMCLIWTVTQRSKKAQNNFQWSLKGSIYFSTLSTGFFTDLLHSCIIKGKKKNHHSAVTGYKICFSFLCFLFAFLFVSGFFLIKNHLTLPDVASVLKIIYLMPPLCIWITPHKTKHCRLKRWQTSSTEYGKVSSYCWEVHKEAQRFQTPSHAKWRLWG